MVEIAAVREEIHDQIVAALDKSLLTKSNLLYIGEKPKPRKVKKRDSRKLLMLEPEIIPSSGVCPGGKYFYISDKERLLSLLRNWVAKKAWVAIDLETGVSWREKPDPDSDDTLRYYEEVIDPYTCPIYLVSMSVEPGVSVVFDMRSFKEDKDFLLVWKEFLQTCNLVAHGSMFEQSFLTAQFGVMSNIVYDTMLVHQLMTAGSDLGSGLGELMERFCGVKLDKQWQKFFLSIDYNSPLPAECIAYSAGDVCQLLVLAKKLEEQLKGSGLHDVWTKYEQPFMKWMALAKVHGIAIDTKFFGEVNVELAEEIDKIRADFDKLCPGVSISAPQQVKSWFDRQGVKLRKADKETLSKLTELPSIGPVAKVVLQYRKAAKMKSTYVEPMLRELPSPITGKVHPNWGQLFTTTGRMNCNDPNMQNMPSKDEWVKIRGGFIAQPGHKLAYCDYSQFEVRAMADMANEHRMIEVFEEAESVSRELEEYCKEHNLSTESSHPKVVELNKRLANCDFHRLTASMLFGTPVEEVTKEQRNKAKAVTFGKPYGAGPKKIAQSAEIGIEEATFLFKDYDVKFPDLAKFLGECREKGKKGCTESPSGRRRFYQLPNFPQLVAKVRMIAKVGGDEWLDMADTWGTNDPYKVAERMHSAKVGSVEREAMNHPIQACNADATKLATIIAAPLLQKLHPECIIIAWVHDEIILTAPEELVEQAANILRNSMIQSAKQQLKRTPVDVSISLGYCWGK